jgi:hypothetical protein
MGIVKLWKRAGHALLRRRESDKKQGNWYPFEE